MLGAIAGDIIGSVYEAHPIKTAAFPLFGPRSRFTDDTVLTVAVAHAILDGEEYGAALRRYISRQTRERLPGELLNVIVRFNAHHGLG